MQHQQWRITKQPLKTNQSALKQMTGSWLLHYHAPLFLLSNGPYISCSAVFDWCLKVMWHYYSPANHRENTPIHSCSEWRAPTCVFTEALEAWRKLSKSGGNSSSVAQPCFCPLGLLSQSNPLQQTEWPACAYAAVAVLVQVVSC